MSKLKESVTNVVKDVTTHWKRPAPGNFVSYKEVLNLGLGGMGGQFTTLLVGYMGLSASNTLLGSTIGIRPLHLQYMAMIQTVLNIVFFIVRGKLVDNTRTKWGRFRPYIAIMGFPLVILSTIFVFLPFDRMGYTDRLVATFCFAIAISMIQPLFTDTYSEVQTVISPNSEERAKIITINSLIYSIAPTITGLFVPILSNLTGGYTNLNTYRFILVPVAIVGVSLNLFTAFGCKERVVSSQSYVQKIGVVEGTLLIFKNKHWWIRTIAGWIGFLESASGVLFGWIYIYGTQDMTTYGVLNTVMGTASGIAMLITPFLLKKLGNKKLLIYHNLLNILFLTLLIFGYKIPLVMFVLFYMNALVNALGIVYNQVMHSEVKDYQQYMCGKRMDFMFGMAGLIGTPLTMLTGLVIPYIYEYMGLTTNYDILYDPNVRNGMFLVLCILSVLGAVLNLVPFCFYSLSKEKHQNIIRVLRYRALFDDYENGTLNAETVKYGVEAIRTGLKLAESPVPDLQLLKAKYLELKRSGDKAAAEQAKNEWKSAIDFAKDQAEVSIFMDELNKFDTPEYQRRIANAKVMISHDVNALARVDSSILAKAKEMPKATKEEKAARRFEIAQAHALLRSAKILKRNYPNGIVEPDKKDLEAAYALPDVSRAEHKIRKAAIKKAEHAFDLYYKAVTPYTDAQKLVANAETRKVIIEESEKRYDEACAELERIEAEAVRKAAQKKADKKAALAGKGGKKQ